MRCLVVLVFTIMAINAQRSTVTPRPRDDYMDYDIHIDIVSSNTTYQLPQIEPFALNIWNRSSLVRNNFYKFNQSDGVVIVKKPGVYLVYYQIVHRDVLRNYWAIGVMVDNTTLHAKCMNALDIKGNFSPRHDDSYTTCSGVTTLRVTRRRTCVHLSDLYGGGIMMLEPELTYWGIVKL